jgi:PAS domain S-box-containing protein
MNELKKLRQKINELEERLGKAEKIEQLLLKSQRELKSVLRNLNGFIFNCQNDPQWTMNYVSEGFERMTAYASEDVIRNKQFSFSSLIHEEDREKVRQEVQQALQKKEKWLVTYRLKNKNGKYQWVWEQGEAIFDSENGTELLEGIILDIHENYEIKKKYTESETRYKEIFNNIIDTYYETSPDGIILEISPSVITLLGLSREEMVGQNAANFYYNALDRDNLIKELSIHKKLQNYEIAFVNKQGEKVICLTSVMLQLDSDNKPLKLIGSLRDITHRKKVETENAKLLSAIEQSPVSVIITNEDGSIQYVNPKFSKITGYTKEEIIGQNPRLLKSGEHDALFYKELWDTIRKGEVWKGEIRNKHKNGHYFWESATITPVKESDGSITQFLAVKEDITSLRNYQKRLEESEKHYRALFMEAPNAYQSLDIQGNILEVNTAWCQLLGYTQKEVITNHITDFLSTRSKMVFNDHFPLFIELGKVSNLEMVFIHKNGSKIDVIVNGQIARDPDGSFKQTHCILSDISEIRKYQIQLQVAKQKAEESDRLKTAFLANMSHEIRTPMNAILGFSNLLRDPAITEEEQLDYINIINQRGNDLLQIISDIIDISRIEAGDIQMNIEKIQINSFLDDIQKNFRKTLEFNNKSHLQLHITEKTLNDQAVLEADTVRLKQVFENLMQNAMKFTSAGSIHIGYTHTDTEIVFFVQDTGIGIESEKQKIVFERFRQANDSHTRDFGGTGLGLAICRNIIQLMGGRLWMKSSPGIGTTFYFSTPYSHLASKEAFDYESMHQSSVDAIDLSGKNLLIVEDVSANYQYLQKVIQQLKGETVWAKDGHTAIKLLKENDDIDLVLMDIQMPGMNGYTTTSRIRQFNKEIPIIGQTAYNLEDNKNEAKTAGFNDFLLKPIKLNEFYGTLAKYLY